MVLNSPQHTPACYPGPCNSTVSMRCPPGHPAGVRSAQGRRAAVHPPPFALRRGFPGRDRRGRCSSPASATSRALPYPIQGIGVPSQGVSAGGAAGLRRRAPPAGPLPCPTLLKGVGAASRASHRAGSAPSLGGGGERRRAQASSRRGCSSSYSVHTSAVCSVRFITCGGVRASEWRAETVQAAVRSTHMRGCPH